MQYIIDITRDEDANVWIAINDEIPLTLESDSLDELIRRVRLAVPELLELNHTVLNDISVLYQTAYHERISIHG